MAHLTALQFDNKNPAGGRGGYGKGRNMLRSYDCFANIFLLRRVVAWILAVGFCGYDKGRNMLRPYNSFPKYIVFGLPSPVFRLFFVIHF